MIPDFNTLAIIGGMEFDVFFRGLLSTIAMFIVLCGGTYLIIATDVGVRKGLLIASAGMFGWMFLMGIIWTIYGKGWIGPSPVWDLVEIHEGSLATAENLEARQLKDIDLSKDVDTDDPDAAQAEALEVSKDENLGDWRYLTTSDTMRGEAQSSVDEFLVEHGDYESGDYLPLQFGSFAIDAKPILKSNPSMWDRVAHSFDETIVHPISGPEYILVQVQGVRDEYTLAGEAPPVAEIDPDKPVVSVVMLRNRGGPIPSLISGLRFTPLAFTIFNGLIFLVLVLVLNNRDLRERKIALS